MEVKPVYNRAQCSQGWKVCCVQDLCSPGSELVYVYFGHILGPCSVESMLEQVFSSCSGDAIRYISRFDFPQTLGGLLLGPQLGPEYSVLASDKLQK